MHPPSISVVLFHASVRMDMSAVLSCSQDLINSVQANALYNILLDHFTPLFFEHVTILALKCFSYPPRSNCRLWRDIQRPCTRSEPRVRLCRHWRCVSYRHASLHVNIMLILTMVRTTESCYIRRYRRKCSREQVDRGCISSCARH